MKITKRELDDKLIRNFSYHDGEILKVTRNKKDVTLLFKDGWNEWDINELKFINCSDKTLRELYDDLEGKIIYQLDDIYNLDGNSWDMSFLVWYKDELLVKVDINAENIISKKYRIKETLLNKNDNIMDKLEEIRYQLGEISFKKINSKEGQALLKKVFKTNEDENSTLNFDNYILISEEDLNEKINNK